MGRVALVTGGSRGIGKAIALELASGGFCVVVNFRSGEEQAQEVVEQIRSQGGEAVALRADVSSADEVEELARRVGEIFGPVNVLVNNAGITRDNLLLRMKDEDWDQVLNTNLKSAFFCSRAFLKDMIKARWGRIVNISSVVGVIGNPGQSNYAASKAGLMGLTRSLAKEVASRNITVNTVAPGYIETEMTSTLSSKVKEAMLAAIPLGRFGCPEEVAKLVAFLVSSNGGYITGQTLVIDGGMTI
jgi:3-oxoacyl-[acyl-carrier protein] reductase